MSFVDSLLGHPRSYYDLELLSNSINDDMPFSSQFDDIEKAIDNLVKSGKILLWRSSFPSMTRSHPEYDYRSSCSLTGRHSGTYELEHMRSRSINASSCYANQHQYSQRMIGYTEHFPFCWRKNKFNCDCNVYTTLEQRPGHELSHFSRGERIKVPSIHDGMFDANDDVVIHSSFSTIPRAFHNYVYDEPTLKKYSSSVSFQDASYHYPLTCYHEYSTNLKSCIENRDASSVIGVGDVKNLCYRKKKKYIMENNDNLPFLVTTSKMKNMIAPIGTKTYNSLSLQSLNQQILDVGVATKPSHNYFSNETDLNRNSDNNALLKKYMVSGMSMHFSWNDRIWSDVKNLGITSNGNGLGLDVLC